MFGLFGCASSSWAWSAPVLVFVAPGAVPAVAARVAAFRAAAIQRRQVAVYPVQIAPATVYTLQWAPAAAYSLQPAATMPPADDTGASLARLRAELGQLKAAVAAHADLLNAHDGALRALSDRAGKLEQRQVAPSSK
jgi:hypothetical protein